ncbi:flagellar assembly peptidoglycan hydrolase FlgJ [Dyella sp.]|uniref:flagellar assembly peptidoglycan hydrolase FlgJ n=1 Tax=Dyella sp. TaxID=1869338 RepID=UPI002ED4DFC3
MAVNDATLQSVNTWTDLSGFTGMRAAAQGDAKSALPQVAKQFESIFTQMMLKSMRDAGMGDGLTDSQAGDSWRDMFDQQLSINLSQHGNGLGIAQMLVKQLGGLNGHGSGSGGVTSADDLQKRLDNAASSVQAAANKVEPFLPQDAADFVTKLLPHAQEAAKKLGVSVRAVLAQAALETQWGKHMPHGGGQTSNNLFGIKAGSNWDGKKVAVSTLEYEDGLAVRKQANFRAYDNAGQSFADYARMIGENPRYAGAKGHGDDVLGFAKGLVAGGYATDPSYAHKVAAIANGPIMRQALAAAEQAAQKAASLAGKAASSATDAVTDAMGREIDQAIGVLKNAVNLPTPL